MAAEARLAQSPSEPAPGAVGGGGLPFERTGLAPGRVVLTARGDTHLSGPLLALVEGIEIGRSRPGAGWAAGEEVAIPIARFPFVALPSEVRFSGEDGVDLAAPLPITTVADAVRLTGPGAVSCDRLRIENGIVSGTIVNAVNGLAPPVLVAKVNEVVRQVAVGPLQLRAEGGSLARISVALEGGDLTETGATIAIHTLPSFEPIARLHFARADRDALTEAVARLEAQVAQGGIKARIDAAGHRRFLEEAVARQQTRLHDIVEYFSVLIYDRAARPLSDPEAAAEIDRTIRAFYETTGRADGARGRRPAKDVVVLKPPHAAYGDDWHGPEVVGGTPVRWMSKVGTIHNPAADRGVTAILVSVLDRLGETPIDLFAALDGGAALPGERLGPTESRGCTFRFTLPEPSHFGLVRLIAGRAQRPCDLDAASPDDRLLSVLVSGVRFLMEPEDADAP